MSIWQTNYKSMDKSRIVTEIARLHNPSRFIADRVERLAFLAFELALKS